jgi:hypothetical protein
MRLPIALATTFLGGTAVITSVTAGSTYDYAVYFDDDENNAGQSNPFGSGFKPEEPKDWNKVDTAWPIFTDWAHVLKDPRDFKKQGNVCGLGKYKKHRQSPIRLQDHYECEDRHAFETPDVSSNVVA